MSLDRFGTTFEVKSIEQRVISGHAAAWALDRVGDVIDKTAFRKTLSEKRPSDVAVFIGHKADELPVGVPLSIEPDEHGLFTTVKVFDGPAGDNLLAVARGLKAAGQTLGLSIGFRVRDARMERRGTKSIRVLTDIDLIEFSYAARQTVANPAALMTDVKTTGGAMRYGVQKSGDQWVVTRDGEPTDATYDSEDAAKSAAARLQDDAGKTLHPNTLPDSAFLFIQTGGVLDDEGKTVPRTLRHFRMRDAAGEIDADAIKTGIGELGAASVHGLTDSVKTRLLARMRTMLDGLDPSSRKTVDATATEWSDGAPIALRGLAFELMDLSEKLAEAHGAMRLLGDDTKTGQRMRPEIRVKVRELAQRLGDLVDTAEYVDQAQDGAADIEHRRRRLQLMGLGV